MADVVWTQRWMAAKCQHFRWSCYISGLHMSKAFNTISRSKLLDVMTSIVGADEQFLMQHLLYSTNISVRLRSYITSSFQSTVGTRQGDGLSPVLFVCYLEAALRDCRRRLPARPVADSLIPHETGYADDINFYSTFLEQLKLILPIVASTLRMWSLNVNEETTEWLWMAPDCGRRTSRQLGSLLGDAEDVTRRISIASQASGKMYSLWMRRNYDSEKRRLRLYRAIVLPILSYNCGTWGLTKRMEEKVAVFHRRQLRHLFGIRYPDRIRNQGLYERCNTGPISSIIKKYQLRLAGHILRLDQETPSCRVMKSYFAPPPSFLPYRETGAYLYTCHTNDSLLFHSDTVECLYDCVDTCILDAYCSVVKIRVLPEKVLDCYSSSAVCQYTGD